jgi:hypothetical protein
MTDRILFRCDACGQGFDYPHTPLDHPLRVHRMVRESRLTESRAEIERLRAALTVISDGRHPDGHRGAVLVARAALEEPTE